MKLNFFDNDKPGNKKKYDYLKNNHPVEFKEITQFFDENSLNNVSFKYAIYSFMIHLCDKEKNSKLKNRLENILKYRCRKNEINYIKNLNELKTEKNYISQLRGGKLTQIINNFPHLKNELIKLYPDVDKLNNNEKEKTRCRVYMFLNDIKNIPKCNICQEFTKFGGTHGFLKTCSRSCEMKWYEIQRYRIKEFNMPSGNVVYLQGYEPLVVADLLNKYKENDIILDYSEMEKYIGEIYYKDKEMKNKRYFPDIFIKSENKIIEVKSSFTFKVDEYNNLKKKEACINKGLKFEFNIWDKKEIL